MNLKSTLPMLLRTLLTSTFMLVSSVVHAQYFLDDFEDGSAVDGNPVTWVPEVPPWPVGQQRVEGGSLILTPPPIAYPNPNFLETDWEIGTDFPTDVVLRTRVRTLGGTGTGYHAVYARDTTSVNAAQGVYTSVLLTTTGFMRLLIGKDLQNTTLQEATFPVLGTRAQDINLELWLAGPEVKVFAWPEGTPRPDTPRLTGVLPLQNITPGRVGIAFAHSVNVPSYSGAFRYFETAPIPEPSTLVLVGIVAAPLMMCVRRPRR